ncbi:helix-turn-helix domain-containing protein [Empedobacter falsenii]|uniref:Helix-turn-helix transcriptional regulator n=1 Tax=Empedobacter falsenii TaxID=343874 RepID=A0AAW7DGT2_9FLAO|nr:AraC family transcriptional regulator [Empedobacter falsenii]MDM1551199.1 helix-turn-helix transcriptional regulator [Empedobacter falsenii]
MKILFLLFFCVSTFAISQSKINQGQLLLSDKIITLSKQKHFNNLSDTYSHGEKMLRYAETDYDKIWVYRFLADVKDKQADYLEAIKLYEIAENYAYKNKYYEEVFMINFLLTNSYRSVGLIEKSENSWKKALLVKDYVNKVDANFFINQNNAIKAEFYDQFCDAIVYRTHNVNIQEEVYKTHKTETNYIDLLAHYTVLAYDYIKCGKIDKGKQYINIVESYLKKLDELEKFYSLEKFYLCKALLAEESNDHEKATSWFDLSYQLAIRKNNNRAVKSIVENALIKNVNLKEYKKQENQLLKTYKDLNAKKLEESSKISTYEISKKDQDITTKEYIIFLISGILVILICLICWFVIKNNRNKKKTKEKFEQLIRALENEKQTRAKPELEIPKEIKVNTESYISEETEKDLLKRLNDFEKGKKYTVKGYSITNLAMLLKTNPKYVSYVISKYKNKNFNDYINHLRIQYITKKIYTEKEYRQYKISYLSEISGFSNHSHFTSVFKKEQQMSPSQFIKLIIEMEDKKS